MLCARLMAIKASVIIISECFSPDVMSPSASFPSTIPAKKPWIRARRRKIPLRLTTYNEKELIRLAGEVKSRGASRFSPPEACPAIPSAVVCSAPKFDMYGMRRF